MESLSISLSSSQANQGYSLSSLINLRNFSKFLCFVTGLLIFLGALVTSNNAGLSVPDWPTSYGQNMFLFPPEQWIGGIFYEHLHRLLASFVGLLTLILALWMALKEPRRSVKLLGFAALFLVCLQGLLGGLTVLFKLPAFVSSAHAVSAQTFFILTIWIAYLQSDEYMQSSAQTNNQIFRLSIICTVLIYIQLIIGAFVRHTESGLAVLDFPTMIGQYLPSFDDAMLERANAMRQEFKFGPVSMAQISIHLLHRFFALIVTLAVAILCFRACFKSEPRIHLTAAALFLVVVLQFTLGIYSVLSLRTPLVASAHVLCGAILLGTSALLSMRSYGNRL